MGHGVEREMGLRGPSRGRIMTGRPHCARMVRALVGTGPARLPLATAMWPSGDADGLIITKEPAASKMKIHLTKLGPDLVYYPANGLYKPLLKTRPRSFIDGSYHRPIAPIVRCVSRPHVVASSLCFFDLESLLRFIPRASRNRACTSTATINLCGE